MVILGLDRFKKIVPARMSDEGGMLLAAHDALGVPVPLTTDIGGLLNVNIRAVNIGVPYGIMEQYLDTNLPAGTSYINFTSVPAGRRWRLKQITLKYVGTVTGLRIRGLMQLNSVNYYLDENSAVVSNSYFSYKYDLIMEVDTFVIIQIVGATAGNDIFAYIYYDCIL